MRSKQQFVFLNEEQTKDDVSGMSSFLQPIVSHVTPCNMA